MAGRDDDNDEDRELPDEADMDQDDGDEFAETEPCPACGRAVYEQADLCPHCGHPLSGTSARRRKPLWLLAGVVLCLVIVLLVWAM